MIRSQALRLAAVSAIALVLGGCGYKPLMAPCSPDDGVPPGYDTTPLAYTSTPRLDLTAPFTPALPNRSAKDACGPLKPI